jgi:signal transduction histidine kinase
LAVCPILQRPRESRAPRIWRFRACSALTDRLLAYSRQQALAPRAVNANTLVGGISDLLQRTLGEQIAMETILGEALWNAFVDPNQLENALINLALNARDAMPRGGKLVIETANRFLDAAAIASLPERIVPGEYVMIAVADTGVGMDEDTRKRAFDPFFTTKEIGKGTGLGLSQVYGFTRQSAGQAQIESELDRGTVVKIYLPRQSARRRTSRSATKSRSTERSGAKAFSSSRMTTRFALTRRKYCASLATASPRPRARRRLWRPSKAQGSSIRC